jgi:SAM-dependent methyltransferase
MSETIETNRNWRCYWEQRNPEDNLLTQVGRTVEGRPISPGQMKFVIDTVRKELFLNRTDIVLDLCCGNGLITRQLAGFCQWIVGVDYSINLINSAKVYNPASNVVYLHRAAAELTCADLPRGAANKICINGALQYFTRSMFTGLLTTLKNISARHFRLLATDVPDAGRLYAFYNTQKRKADLERRLAAGEEAIGTWWDREELGMLTEQAGYTIEFIEQDPRRHTAHYRYDFVALLKD